MTNATKPDSSAATSPRQQRMAAKLETLKKPEKVKPFTKKELVHMFRGVGSMLRAQINTSDSLKYYSQGLPNKAMADALEQVRLDIERGMNAHEAFRRTGRFSEMVIGLIQAGSDAGQLHEAFRALSDRMTSEMHFEKAIRKATLIPAVIIAVLILAFIISQVKIVPQVEEMLLGVGAEPDGITAISFKISHITQSIWWIVVGSIIATAIIISRSKKVQGLLLGIGMSRWRLLRMLIMSLRQMSFIGTIRLLHSNGVNLAKSIRTSANSVKNTPFYDELRTAADKYENSGVPLSTAFAKYTSVDQQATHMLSIGEKSASLDMQLDMLAEMYEEDANNYMASFAAAVSFLVMIIAVMLIAAVFIGTFLPIFLMGPKMIESGV